ncbi:MAG: VanZ family protein [Chloroflexi bacterium]|nr:VanZ family protein [Chloroflexota bacterium]
MEARRGLPWVVLHLVPVLAWAGVIFWLSGRSADQAEDYLGPFSGVRYVSGVFHFGEYFVLTLLLFRALAEWRRRASSGQAPLMPLTGFVLAHIAGLTSMLYAISDEYHQTFVSGRVFSVEDLAIDLAGTVTGIGVAWGWVAWRRAAPGLR